MAQGIAGVNTMLCNQSYYRENIFQPRCCGQGLTGWSYLSIMYELILLKWIREPKRWIVSKTHSHEKTGDSSNLAPGCHHTTVLHQSPLKGYFCFLLLVCREAECLAIYGSKGRNQREFLLLFPLWVEADAHFQRGKASLGNGWFADSREKSNKWTGHSHQTFLKANNFKSNHLMQCEKIKHISHRKLNSIWWY